MKLARTLLLTIFGLLVFGATMTFASLLPAWAHYATRGGLLVLFAGLWLASRGSGSLSSLRPIFMVYFAITLALTLAYYAGDPLLAAMHFNAETAMGSAMAKFMQSLLVVIGIITVTLLSGETLGSLYLRKGRLLLGFSLGLLGMAVFIGLTFVPGGPFLKTVNTAEGMSKLMAVVPWVALFVLSNAFMEELLFRGVLLQRYEALTGKWLALFSTTIVFALAHVQVTYAANLWQFVLMVFGLGLMWGFLMQKSKSIWGSVLFHAGADVAIILPIYQSMGG